MTGIEEDSKTGNSVRALSGDFDFGSIISTSLQIKYSVTHAVTASLVGKKHMKTIELYQYIIQM